MNYDQTLTFLLEKLPMFQRIGPAAIKKDLTNTIKLLDFLGNPQYNFKSIHVGGTNGKGSVSHILASLLDQAGYSVGIYTSPHYKDIRERIKVNRSFIEKKFLTDFVKRMMPIVDEIQPSYFELLVAMAFDYFRYKEVDWAVIEVGLGGRLDSTNVIQPALSIITNISLDHQNLLGETRDLIAGEKAGIIKPATPIIIGERQEEVEQVFIQKANREGAPLTFGSDVAKCTAIKKHKGTMMIQMEDYSGSKLVWQTELYGEYQLKNIQTAYVAALELEQQKVLTAPQQQFSKAIANLRKDWKFIGRMQLLKKKPLVIADSAHNEAGLQFLIEEISQIPYTNLHIIIGTVNDKKPDTMLAVLPKTASYYFCKPNIPRGLEVRALEQYAVGHQLTGTSYDSCMAAYEAALESATEKDLIVVCGSIFVVAELI